MDNEEMREGLNRLRTTLAELEEPSYIHKVSTQQRRVNAMIYNPQVVAIGPYHRNKEELKPMEMAKLVAMKRILRRRPEVSIEEYWTTIGSMERRARECYLDTVCMNSADFIGMMLVDCMFIIEVISPDSTTQQVRAMDCVLYDLLLLENQVPFFILSKIFELVNGDADGSFLLISLLLGFCNRSFPGKKFFGAAFMRNADEVQHILDLVHSNWYTFPNESLGLINPAPKTTYTTAIPTASQLQLANVKFVVKEYSTILEFFNIEFVVSQGGIPAAKLYIPSLVIEQGTEIVMKNLIAHEYYFSKRQLTPVTDFARLLNCLIETEEDVIILSRRGIIKNRLGTNQAVAQFAKRLSDGIVDFDSIFLYGDLFDRVSGHHKKANAIVSWKTHLVEFRRTYFRTPWTVVSIIAAVMLLLLTCFQAVMAGIQTFRN